MFNRESLIVSAPAQEFSDCLIPGGIFDAALVNDMPVSAALRRAVTLVTRDARRALLVVRPEIYTHGSARQWLDARVRGFRCHVNLSDGTAIKLLEGIDNHLFVYALTTLKSRIALANLLRWAPESVLRFRSQLNSFHGVLLEGQILRPPCTLLLPSVAEPGEFPDCHGFFLVPSAPEESARMTCASGLVQHPNLLQYEQVVYVPLTDSGLHDARFARATAEAIAAAYLQPSRCVILRLPAASGTELHERLTMLFKATTDSGVALPRVRAANVFLTGTDVPESCFDSVRSRLSMIFDDSFEFWRYTRRHYASLQCARYTCLGGEVSRQGSMQGLQRLLGKATPAHGGDDEPLTWLRAKAADAAARGRTR